ncbi:MAG: hypothetical protein M1822_000053 [Bathelium mastoideum]|nr:MAG: hypothetical protein M1822_000053 [Bathelium mastoideum]
MKKKAETGHIEAANGVTKKRFASSQNVAEHFRTGLFEEKQLQQYESEYSSSEPYKHGVIPSLINPSLLRSVRDEIRTHLSFTPKETDIYRLHQSGDLANLSGLDASSLARLPSLLTLRDALYSPDFRSWIARVADSGPLSGQKTDMAINVYTPGDHLLCHDDVIGTRRLSYILYLTDPKKPWKAEWGGALRLYPLETRIRSRIDHDTAGADEEIKVPSPEWSKSIPPEFNQLSFFAVQPGESFHDVEEVYHRPTNASEEDDGGRVRMAISGWYHIPQSGEDGYEEGLEKKLAEKSSLAQLQGNVDEFDEPQVQWNDYFTADGEKIPEVETDEDLSESELDYLLQFMNPKYLTPDTVEQLEEMFVEDSSLRLADFLSTACSHSLREYLSGVDSTPWQPDQKPTSNPAFHLARPPHKHRFLYLKSHPSQVSSSSSPLLHLLNDLFASLPFRKWLALATGLVLGRSNLTARRFRHGTDYTLATAYECAQPQLEFTLGMTPSGGWEDAAEAARGDDDGDDVGDDDAEDDDPEVDEGRKQQRSEEVSSNGDSADEIPAESSGAVSRQRNGAHSRAKNPRSKSTAATSNTAPHVDVGGHEVYMAADEGASASADPAQYRSATATGEEDDGDDGVLFTAPAGFNTLSVVLRDEGVLRFVKYVSQAAKGDRWDMVGEFEVLGEGEGEGKEDTDE